MLSRGFIGALFILVYAVEHTVPLPQPGLGLRRSAGGTRNRTPRDIACRTDREYSYGSICCLNCPAGTHMTSPCTTAGGEGTCESCDSGTYTEHGNGLKQCLKCTKCRSDQETVAKCTSTQDTKCQCKLGSFCHPEQACEVCKKCLRCKEGEVEEKKCTPTNDTVCRGRSNGYSTFTIVFSVVASAALLGLVILGLWMGGVFRAKGSQTSPRDSLNVEVDSNQSLEEMQNRENQRMDLSQFPLLPQRYDQAVSAKSPSPNEEDEDKGLGDSLANTASNSQSSLSVQAPALLYTSSPKPSPTIPRQPNARENEPFPELVPLNGEQSLQKTFEYFEEVDLNYHKRFFRLLDIHENIIKSKDNLPLEDRIHELLNIWREKVGKEASINDLLRALLKLNQKLTAEKIMAKAVNNGYYSFKKELNDQTLP